MDSLTVLAVVSFYMVVSLSQVFLNKIVLLNFHYPYPTFMTWIQLLVAEFFIILFGWLKKSVPVFPLTLFEPWQWNWTVAWKVLPLSLCFVGSIGFSNVCLNYVEVTYFQVARCTTILWTIFLTRQQVNDQTFKACLMVVIGFVIGSLGEVNFDVKGLIAGTLSSAFLAYYGILVKEKITHLPINQWHLLLYNTTFATILIIPIIFLLGEGSALTTNPPSLSQLTVILLTGVVGLLINIAVFLQIHYTTPLTSTVSGTVKACLQTVLGWFIFGNQVSLVNGIGILMVIGGSGWYSYVRYLFGRQLVVPPAGVGGAQRVAPL